MSRLETGPPFDPYAYSRLPQQETLTDLYSTADFIGPPEINDAFQQDIRLAPGRMNRTMGLTFNEHQRAASLRAEQRDFEMAYASEMRMPMNDDRTRNMAPWNEIKRQMSNVRDGVASKLIGPENVRKLTGVVDVEAPPEPDKDADAKKKDEDDAKIKAHKMRAQTFDNYSIVCALIFGFACTGVEWSYGDYLANLSFLSREATDSVNTIAYQLRLVYFAHVSMMVFIASLTMYSTMVFVLSGVYTRTGMSMRALTGLDLFLKDLQGQRDAAFKAFILAATILPLDIILQTFANLMTYGFHQSVLIYVMLTPAVLIAAGSSWHVYDLVRAAGYHLFGVGKPKPPPEPSAQPSPQETQRIDGKDEKKQEGPKHAP